MKVRICDKEVIPPFRKLKFTEDNGAVIFYILFFEVDKELTIELNRDNIDHGNKRKSYWKGKSKDNSSDNQDFQTETSKNEPKSGKFEGNQNHNYDK
jgi:hypothetical protein